jgi:hypothetical protein
MNRTNNKIDQNVELHYTLVKCLALAVPLFVFAGLAFGLAYDRYQIKNNLSKEMIAVVLMGVASALYGALPACRALMNRKSVVTLSREGIHDRRLTPNFIPWSAIEDVSYVENKIISNIALGKCVILHINKQSAVNIQWHRKIRPGQIWDGLHRLDFETNGYGIGMSQMSMSCQELSFCCIEHIQK